MGEVLDALLDRNRKWSAQIRAAAPDYFDGLAEQQTPEFLWIGCSDSRVPANVISGLAPGEVFVHRNVANVVHSSDMNLLSVLEFAVEALKVRQIIVCGHYGCGGVRAATEEDLPHGLADHWLEPIRRLAKRHIHELSAIEDVEMRRDRLAEFNVLESVARVAETPILRRAWSKGEYPLLHGLIYGIRDGILRSLDCTLSGADRH
ncbi:carbonic anhydrase [Albidovulum sediminicola]|uniref:Carbonic anhydrase n=1 Tax=Albidovulum sediminicola TaxID=2984331 RepID=A0ABT2YY33_9RHOB|nr:carbonic anhydrase [Defluviimonas sp. WL0075]MCV2863792.1 carbonic anhydrase [Defluviimonas sp. WL0075]